MTDTVYPTHRNSRTRSKCSSNCSQVSDPQQSTGRITILYSSGLGYLWAFCVLLATVIAICICTMLSENNSDRTLMTVVENSQYPVFKIKFPAIGVCTRHRINWARIQKARNKFLPIDASNKTIETFMSFVKRLDSLEFQKFDQMEGLENEPLHLINALSVYKIAFYLAFRCEEIFIKGSCFFAGQSFDCCTMFIPEKTHKGMCMVYNSVISALSRQKAAGDKFYPYRNSKNGEGSGLIFKVRGDLSNEIAEDGLLHNTGIDLMIKKSDEWTDWKTYNLRINTNNEIVLQPELIVTHDELKYYPFSFRKCLFENEKSTGFFIPNLRHHLFNCRTQCHQEYLIRYCNCTMPQFFNIIGITADECKPSDYICIYKNRNVFTNVNKMPVTNFNAPEENSDVIDCGCLPSCIGLHYPITMNTMPVYNISGNTMATRVDVFYQSEVMMRYLTTLKYSILDLTGYFGGIVTLFLGASVLTGAEFIHFVILEICLYFNKNKTSIPNRELRGNPKK